MAFGSIKLQAGKGFRCLILDLALTFSLRNKRPTTCDPNGHIAERKDCVNTFTSTLL